MKKIIILLFSIFFLSGCTVRYNLEYIDEVFKESLEITSNKDETYDGINVVDYINNYYSNVNLLVDYNEQPGDMSDDEVINNYSIYNKTLINKEYEYGINLDYAYKDIEYSNSSIVFTGFQNIQIKEDSIIIENGRNLFENYDGLEEVLVSFKTDKKVLETNADEVKDNVYYWHINKYNYDKLIIKIMIDKNIILDDYNKTVDVSIKYTFIVLSVILVISFFYILVKFLNSNKK